MAKLLNTKSCVITEIMDKENTDWLITTERYVAFLDIMGFKEMVIRNTHNNIYLKLKDISEMGSFIGEIIKEVYVTIFSDSIILFSKDNSEKSFKEITKAALVLLAKSIKLGLGIKGGLAKGIITVDRNNQIYFGQPIIDAYMLEEDLNYYGLVVHHSAENDIKEYKAIYSNCYYLKCKTFFKSGQINHYNLDWFCAYGEDRKKSTEELNKYLDNIAMSVSGNPRKYIDNTFEMMDRVETTCLPTKIGNKMTE